jgi:predicted Zn-dependent protease
MYTSKALHVILTSLFFISFVAVSAQQALAVASVTGKVTCLTRTSHVTNQGVSFSYIIGTDAYFNSATHASAYSYDLKHEQARGPLAVYASGNKSNRLILSGVTGHQIDFNSIPVTMFFPNGAETITKDGVVLLNSQKLANISSNLPKCTGAVVSLATSSSPSNEGGSTTSQPETCNDGIKNQNETSADRGGICSTEAELGNCSDGVKNSNETGVDSGGRCAPAELGELGPGSHEVPIGHWYSTAMPTRISVDDRNLSPLYRQFVPKALRDWNLATSVVITENGTDSVQIPIKDGDYGQTGWVGVTNIHYNGDHISSAPVFINNHWMNTSSYNNDVQRTYVVEHELGHAFGVGHQDTDFCNVNTGSVMDYTYSIEGGTHQAAPCDSDSHDSIPPPTINFGVNNKHPNQNDINTIQHQYDHHH